MAPSVPNGKELPSKEIRHLLCEFLRSGSSKSCGHSVVGESEIGWLKKRPNGLIVNGEASLTSFQPPFQPFWLPDELFDHTLEISSECLIRQKEPASPCKYSKEESEAAIEPQLIADQSTNISKSQATLFEEKFSSMMSLLIHDGSSPLHCYRSAIEWLTSHFSHYTWPSKVQVTIMCRVFYSFCTHSVFTGLCSFCSIGEIPLNAFLEARQIAT